MLALIPILQCAAALLVCFYLWRFLRVITKNYYLAKKLNLPGPVPMRPIIGNMGYVRLKDAVEIFNMARELAREYKYRSYKFWGFGQIHMNIINCRDTETIMSSSKHSDKNFLYYFLHPFLGTGLLTANGKKWQQRRRILTPTFHFNILKEFLAVFHEECEKFTELLKTEIVKDDGTNLPPLTSHLTLNTVCETAMGVKLDSYSGSKEYRNSIQLIGELLLHRFLRPWFYNETIYALSGYRKKLLNHLKPVHSFTRKIIKLRREHFLDVLLDNEKLIKLDQNDNIYETKKKRYAMLDTLLAAEADGLIDDEGIREEVDTFTFEGHDTTSAALTFIFLLLAHHIDVQEKVYEEIKIALEGNDNQPLGMNELNDLEYTSRVIKECLRIYPSVPFITRSITEDMMVEGEIIPKGSIAHIHIFDLHRDPEQFPDPERFDPDRFLPENVEKRHPFAYVPFSAGPRNCIGQKFALLEIKTVLQHVLMEFTLSPVTTREEIEFVGDIILRAKTPIKVRFHRRVQS
ncbi:probable cytochrome P450 4ac1 [Lutzomyia longipalpis]|uniref:probable cytochrome P450 4ac1 n=1 Tax=Lutzomyia longipalpis TaxID=7200 RepID=UPI00248371D6|nr:probable cytochrome P450 4ac1 [Lutzomyia longipalpis]